MERISEHVSYKEATKSNTASRLGIDNTPNSYHLSNMGILGDKLFEPLRRWVGGPIKINSFYRSPELNAAIGGSYKIENGKKIQTSQHCQGRAVDIDDTFGHKSNAEMFAYIKNNLDFDQIIWEFGDDLNPDWVHVSYVSENENRSRALKAVKTDGKTKYEVI